MTPLLRVAVICTGNICRSPMGEVILRELVADDPSLAGRVVVTSAGTARWHVGKEMDPRTRNALNRAGYLSAGTLGEFASSSYLDDHDIVVVMTNEHRKDVTHRLTSPDVEVIMLRDLYEVHSGLDVHDPYYGDDADFDACLETVSRGCRTLQGLLRQRVEKLEGSPPAE